MPPAPPVCHGSPSRPIISESSRAWTAESEAISTAAWCADWCEVPRAMPEIRLHFAALFGQQQRQHGAGPKACAIHASSRVRKRGLVERQRAAGLREQLLPSRRVPVLDGGQSLEQIAPLRLFLDRGQLAIEQRRVALVAIMLVPARVRYGPLMVHHSRIVLYSPETRG